ncbi:hypothetical protein C8J56DRAFT_912429 [Mycena floridula]|nr:hypothetical protein C8J56DRAFT_912429 [Mycena floridula]
MLPPSRIHPVSERDLLPSYSTSPPPPCYSSDLNRDEEILEYSPRSLTRSPPTGSFTKNLGSLVLVLNNQDRDVELPCYGLNGSVSGHVELKKCDFVSLVQLKLQGRIVLTISEGGSKVVPILSDSYTLWRHDADSKACPSSLSFSATLPLEFKDGGKKYPLPPTYGASFLNVPGLFVSIGYTLSVLVVKQRMRGYWIKTKSITTRFNYQPNSRPHRPIIPLNSILRSLKSAPEEWHDESGEMKVRPGAGLEPLFCHFLLPSVLTYALSDTIPFHVQLTGQVSSLREFLPPTEEVLSCASSSRTKNRHVSSKGTVSVSLLRQITVEVRGEKAWRNVVMGEGNLWPLPPPMRGSQSVLSLHSSDEALDWQGEICCKENKIVGGFNAGAVSVKDFIVLSLKPPDPQKSALLESQIAVPIRLVTEQWIDSALPP